MNPDPWRSMRAGLVGLTVGSALLPFPLIGVMGVVGLLLAAGQIMSAEVRSRDPSLSPRSAAVGLALLGLGSALLAVAAIWGVFLVQRAAAPASMRVPPIGIGLWIGWAAAMLFATLALVAGLRYRANLRGPRAWRWGAAFLLVSPVAALLSRAILAFAPTDV